MLSCQRNFHLSFVLPGLAPFRLQLQLVVASKVGSGQMQEASVLTRVQCTMRPMSKEGRC